jgi:hypothetical protein
MGKNLMTTKEMKPRIELMQILLSEIRKYLNVLNAITS